METLRGNIESNYGVGERDSASTGIEIAIIGMAGQFPGARDVDQFWANIRDKVESVTQFTDEDLRQKSVSKEILSDPSYVKAGVVLDGMDQFDAAFFGYTPRDAEQLDPQQRLFLECAWQALEHAGYDPDRYSGSVGVYGGSGAGLYWIKHLLPSHSLGDGGKIADLLGLLSGNAPDSLCTRAAYKLNLRGPAVTVQTACSTSLMAVHMACQSLLGHECDMALAGGVSLNLLQNGGYFHQTGAIFSPDGHCRAFDADAAGTLLGSGAGLVVLKRLDDALRDGDTIHAIIKGSAANNDGADKIGFTAPGVNGQAEAIRTAQLVADVEPDTIGYIEAHGTGTPLGDPIEIAALTQAFRANTQRRNFCAIGSVKTNVGHLDAAAGVTGLIKAIMALKHRTLPASLNFSRPNPAIDFASSPFFVNTETRPWPEQTHPRRAGVSSFGIGGTNIHVILEEMPAKPFNAEYQEGRDARLVIPLSARSEGALREMCVQLANHLESHPHQSPADIAGTLLRGRRQFPCRAVAVAKTRSEAIETLRTGAAPGFQQGNILSARSGVAFLFPGQGAQYPGMGRELYESEGKFRQIVDDCCAHLRPNLGLDLREILFGNTADVAERLSQTALTQPALFVIEYALAQQWIAWGLRPAAMLGHSIGEYVAACLAGVFSLQDALDLVVERGRLMQSTAPGAMLTVHAGVDALVPEVCQECDFAALNADDLCVLSGTVKAIANAERILTERSITTQRLHVSHAFHSPLLEPVLPDFRSLLQKLRLNRPNIPFISNVTGHWITNEQACSVEYWVSHLRGTVRFHEGLTRLLDKADLALLEVGPGETLITLARRHVRVVDRPLLASQCHPKRGAQNGDQPLLCAAKLWTAGVALDYETLFNARGGRIPLPTYPFERQSYWVAPRQQSETEQQQRPREITDWFYAPVWQRMEPAKTQSASDLVAPITGCLLILAGRDALSHALSEHWTKLGQSVIWVEAGSDFAQLTQNTYVVRPDEKEDFAEVLKALPIGTLSHICHLWNLDDTDQQSTLEKNFYSLLALAQALDMSGHISGPKIKIKLTVIASQLEDVSGSENIHPENAVIHGPCRVIPQEYPKVNCQVLDVPAAEKNIGRLTRQVIAEMLDLANEPLVALRGPYRWKKTYSTLIRQKQPTPPLRRQGVYLITGGMGGIGLIIADHLVRNWQAKLVLVGRSELPRRNSWPDLIAQENHPLNSQLSALMELESHGEVLVLRADITDHRQLEAAISQAENEFGAINGVIHAAGTAGGGMIASKTSAAVDKVFAAKIRGTCNLISALERRNPDFLLLCSSMTAIAGGFGQVDYCAANCFLDAIASSRRYAFVTSVNWDVWRNTGMAAAQNLPEEIGIDPALGGQLLEHVLATELPQIAVSAVEISRQFHPIFELADRLSNKPAEHRCKKERPLIQTPYMPPTDELSMCLVEQWSDFLGIKPIGINDNLFELGGDSLLAIQLLAKVRATYGVDIHPGDLFKTPTIAVLSELIEIGLIEEIENADSTILESA